MRITQAFLAIILGMTGTTNAVLAAPGLYNNEAKIDFKTNSGNGTDAIEGHFFVDENRNAKHSRKIRVNYVRFPATGEKQGPPIIYLSGGPGGSGISTAKGHRFTLFMALREFGDVIALDQRGTGLSEKADKCVSNESIPLNQKMDADAIKSKYRKAAKQCLTDWQSQGIDIYGYTTVQNALDIEALRKHLNAEKVSLWGISYGSHVALSALKLFPQHIEKVVIASAEGLDQTVKLPAHTDAYFARVQAVIDQQPELKKLINNFPGMIKRVHNKLHKQPLSLEIPSRSGAATQILFQKHHIQALASRMIADPNQYLAVLVGLYYGLDNNNYEMLTHVLSRGMFNDKPIEFQLMPLAMDVASGVTPARMQLIQQQAKTSLLNDVLNFPMPFLDKVDTKLDLGDEFRAAPQSNVPTLLFTGTLDGRTYPQEQAEAVKGLSQLSRITIRYAGHNLFMASPEVQQRIEAFLADEKVDVSTINLPLPSLQM